MVTLLTRLTTTATWHFVNKNDVNSTMAFKVATTNGVSLTNFTANSAEAKAKDGKHTPLYVHIDHAQWDQAVAGVYEGHITFDATLADAQ